MSGTESGASRFEYNWLQSTWNQIAIRRAAETAHIRGRGLPCHVVDVMGSILEIAFDVSSAPYTLPNVVLPKAESQYIRAPLQVGDHGIAVPAGTYLTGITGQGGGLADLTVPGNLDALYFLPIASTGFPAVDTTKAFIAGPTGAVIQTLDGKSVLLLTETGLTYTLDGVVIWNLTTTGGAMAGQITTTGDQIAGYGGQNISQLNHDHGGVQTGSGNTGPPNAGT